MDCGGSIDWVCFPRFDSGACFAALLGDRDNGRWRICPRGDIRAVRRRYRGETLILETELETADGVVRLIDFMPLRGERPDIVRIVEGVSGVVTVSVELTVRFDTGRIIPWVRRRDDALTFTAGPDALCLRGDVDVHGQDFTTVGEFELRAGERRKMTMTWFPSHQPLPECVDPLDALEETERWWQEWSAQCTYEGAWKEAVRTSLRVLKALTFGPTGGIVASPTTSLPEWIGSSRNWDYRYCWLRDATLTLYAFMLGGYTAEAEAWREWLLRAAAGDPARLQIMYGVGGEQRLLEFEAPWLSGFAGSKPVRIGNAAHQQVQLDVFGEVNDTFYQARRLGIAPDPWSWSLEAALLESLEKQWRQPDHGIWEVRGPQRHFTHSKVMAWVAFDRTIKSACKFGLQGPVAHWRRSATRSTPTRARTGTTPGAARSPAPTATRSSMRPCCSSRWWGSCRPTIHASPAPFERSRATSSREGSSCDTGRTIETPTGSPPAKACFCRAASGWPTSTFSWDDAKRPPACSRNCSRSEMTSACFPKSTTRNPAGCWGTFRRPSPTSR